MLVKFFANILFFANIFHQQHFSQLMKSEADLFENWSLGEFRHRLLYNVNIKWDHYQHHISKIIILRIDHNLWNLLNKNFRIWKPEYDYPIRHDNKDTKSFFQNQILCICHLNIKTPSILELFPSPFLQFRNHKRDRWKSWWQKPGTFTHFHGP